jgi:hypothetical protein
MNPILEALAVWTLVQVLIVWLWARLAPIRGSDAKDYLELREYLMRSGLQSTANRHIEPPRDAATREVPSSRSCSSVTVAPAGARRTPARSLRAPHPLCAAGPPRARGAQRSRRSG